MSTYICNKCGCVDNTACNGNYHLVEMMKHGHSKFFKDEYSNTHHLCSECTPVEYKDGSANTRAGKWHNVFPKKHWSEYGTKEYLLEQCNRHEGNFANANEYFNTE